MTSTPDILAMLAEVPVFHGFRPRDFEVLGRLVKSHTAAPGETLIREGETGESMYLLLSGRLLVSKKGDTTTEAFLDHLDPGAAFGEFSLIDRAPRSATVKAIESSEVLTLSRDAFDSFLTADGHRGSVFYKNCLQVTFSRFRHLSSSFSTHTHRLNVTTAELEDIHGDMQKARKLQAFFLNPSLLGAGIRCGTLSVQAIYRPCQDVGGDLVDVVVREDGTTAFFIADVCGHGVSGAIATGVLKSAFGIFARDTQLGPAALMTRLNVHSSGLLDDLYATAYLAIWDPAKKQLGFSKAGHPMPLLWRAASSHFEEFGLKGVCLGFDAKSSFQEVWLPFAAGDTLLFHTDGITEQENPGGEPFGEERLHRWVRGPLSQGAPLTEVLGDLTAHAAGRPLEDDISALLIRA